jgi:nucleoside-diphosphate-sugar epimerase
MGRKYLVTGAHGNVGFHVVEQLLAEGKDVRASDMVEASAFAKNFGGKLPKRLEYKPANLTDEKSIKHISKGITDVIHVAALFHHNASKEKLREVNIFGTVNVIRAAHLYGIEKVVSFGTSSIYGYEQVDSGSGYAFDESSTPNPQNPYAESKQEGREIVASFNGVNGMQVRIVDPTGIFGPRNKYGNLTVLEAAVNGAFWLPTKGKNRASNVHAKDAAGFSIYLLDHIDIIDSTDPQELSYLVATPDAPTGKELMEIVWDNIPYGKRKEKTRSFMEFLGRHKELTEGMALPFANIVHKLLGKHTPDILNPYVARYGFSNQSADPSKMLATGYKLQFPCMEDVIEDTMKYHIENPTGLLFK